MKAVQSDDLHQCVIQSAQQWVDFFTLDGTFHSTLVGPILNTRGGCTRTFQPRALGKQRNLVAPRWCVSAKEVAPHENEHLSVEPGGVLAEAVRKAVI